MFSDAPYNLLTSPWIPIRRGNGQSDWIPPSRVTEYLDDPDKKVVALNAPRPDFNGALHEFLIGLLATAFAPEDEEDWLDIWETPPTPEQLAEAFSKYKQAFNLDGDGPRFMQDFEELETEPVSISSLLIGEPGDQTILTNKDLFQKRSRIGVLSRPAAAMALFTLQCYAPGGGQGYRTSLRGGGPLTTLIDPSYKIQDENISLWRRLWANVETLENIKNRPRDKSTKDPEYIFPWLAPTRTSNTKKGGQITTPIDVNPLQLYWGMPRRITLMFEPANGRCCDLTGIEDAFTITAFRAKNYGVQYSDSWDHPLSPHAQKKANEPKLPLKGQPDGISYRHWLGLTLGTESRFPAACIKRFENTRATNSKLPSFRILCFGFDMDNAKARSWIESEMPVHHITEDQREDVENAVKRMIEAADISAQAVFSAIKTAGQNPGTVKDRFWRETEHSFFKELKSLIRKKTPDKKFWWACLQKTALSIFDDLVPMTGIEDSKMEKLIRARYSLVHTFTGRNRDGKKLYKTLKLPAPKVRKKKDKAA